jgi:hypothetical protein
MMNVAEKVDTNPDSYPYDPWNELSSSGDNTDYAFTFTAVIAGGS